MTPEPWTCPQQGCTRPLEAHPIARAALNRPPNPQPEKGPK